MLVRKNNISYGLLAFAFVFLFNPCVSVIDPLPDVIGYIILSAALSKISMLSETLYDAKRAFERLVIIDSAKILSLLWIFGAEAVSERSISLLLWSFIFGALEIVFAIPAYLKLFEGFSYMGNFYPNTSIHQGKGKRRVSYTDFVKGFSVFFVIFKAVFTCLPETAAIYDESSPFRNIYRYIGVMRGLCIIPVLIVGIAWLVSMIRYFNRISRDKAFVDAVNNEYSQKKLTKIGAFVIKDVRIASVFMVIASVLSIDLTLDGINILPDILVIVFLGISLFYFSKATRIKKPFVIVSFALFSIAAMLEDFIRYYFADNFYYNAIEKNHEAFTVYLLTVIAVAVEGLMLVLVYFSVARALRSVVSEHTGYVVGREIDSEGEKKQILSVQNELNKNFYALADVAIVCALAETFVSLYGAFYAFLNKNLGWMSLIGVSCGLLLVGMTVKAVSKLKEAVQTKYMLE